MARTSHFSKQALIIFLAFLLHFTAFTNAYAAASSGLGGWSITNTIQQGATSILTGAKDLVLNGKNYIKTGTAKITPTASQVAKQIVKTGAVGAVALAIDLLLDGADYVMDPANNRVIYYENDDCTANNTCQYTWSNGSTGGYASAELACKAWFTQMKNSYGSRILSYSVTNVSINVGNKSGECLIQWKDESSPRVQNLYTSINPAYDPTAEREEKYLPYTTVGQQIIDDAESGRNEVAPPYIGGVAQDLVANDAATQADVQSQLESSAQTKPADAAEAESANEATGSSKPNTANPDVTDISLEFPVFCSWAPSVCEAAQVVISFPQTLANWWDTATTSISEAWTQVKDWVTEATDYFKEEPELDNDTELEIPDITESPDTTISFGGYCPAPLSTPVNFAGISTSIDIEFTWLCQLADFIKPIVIALSSFTAALIVAGIRMEDD